MVSRIIRCEHSPVGALGVLLFNGEIFCYTLQPDAYDPQRFYIPAGQYIARRFNGTKWKDTFEIVRPGTNGVDGHTALLFHSGNIEEHTYGCILLGETVGKLKGNRAVLNSGNTFKTFLKYTENVNSFPLTIIDVY